MENLDPLETFRSFIKENQETPDKKMTKSDLKKLIKENLNKNISEKEEKEEEEEEMEDALADLAGEEDIDVDIEEPTEEEPALEGDASEVQDHLEQAMEVAREMGDKKLETQIGNTIVYLNRSQYSKVNESRYSTSIPLEIQDIYHKLQIIFNRLQNAGETNGHLSDALDGLKRFLESLNENESPDDFEPLGNDTPHGGYIEVMGPQFDKAIMLLKNAWQEWKEGPMTERSDITPARMDIVNYIKRILD